MLPVLYLYHSTHSSKYISYVCCLVVSFICMGLNIRCIAICHITYCATNTTFIWLGRTPCGRVPYLTRDAVTTWRLLMTPENMSDWFVTYSTNTQTILGHVTGADSPIPQSQLDKSQIDNIICSSSRRTFYRGIQSRVYSICRKLRRREAGGGRR